MIAIVNVGTPKNPKREDERMYEVKINRKALFGFIHNTEEPLSVCLARAANAAAQYESISKIMEEK